MTTKLERRLKIKAGVRGKISGTTERPRLTVFRSNKQIYAQVIDDTTGKTLAAASSLKLDVKAPKKEIAAKVGELIAKDPQKKPGARSVSDKKHFPNLKLPIAPLSLEFAQANPDSYPVFRLVTCVR